MIIGAKIAACRKAQPPPKTTEKRNSAPQKSK